MEAIENVLADNETSMMLKPFVTKIKMAFVDTEPESSIRNFNCTSLTQIEYIIMFFLNLQILAKLVSVKKN